MIWEKPELLLALWALPLVAALLVFAESRRRRAAARFLDPRMGARLMPALSGPRTWIKGALLLLGLAALIVASARPKFGVYYETVQQRGVDCFILLDVSRSMLAQDVAPDRLERAKSDILDLLPKLEGDRVGLIAFAGQPVIAVPLTTDQVYFKEVLDRVDPNSAPLGGSLIGDSIRKALASMEERRDRDQLIILITDGEDQESEPLQAAELAANRGARIFAIGLGNSEEGARIPVRDEYGNVTYVKHDGQEVWSRMDEKLLQEIALSTNGVYVPARTSLYDLGKIYDDYFLDLEQGEYRTERRRRYREQFQIFVCLGIALLLAEMLIPACPRMQSLQSPEVIS
ncbi:MAG: VWA domain-containing protein [Planctomycetota bacterium]